MSARKPPELKELNRRLTSSRRHIRKAVEKFAGITDPLPGHRAEALRQMREVKAAADELVARAEALD